MPRKLAARVRGVLIAVVWCTSVGPTTSALAAPAASFHLDPASQLTVLTKRGGFLKFAGHDHVIAADSLHGEWKDAPDTTSTASIRLTIFSKDLRVADEDHPDDVPKIQREMEESVLDVDAHPEIRFRSTFVGPVDSEGQLEIRGFLSLRGKTQVVAIRAVREATTEGHRLRGETRIRQSQFGIDPISIGLGAVTVQDEVEVQFDLLWVRKSASP